MNCLLCEILESEGIDEVCDDCAPESELNELIGATDEAV